uniref:Uncharacterized protein n=1 Tax=Rhizophora mucronata TaxID=61149 RepID=A0A2P2NMU1_RHIMU
MHKRSRKPTRHATNCKNIQLDINAHIILGKDYEYIFAIE